MSKVLIVLAATLAALGVVLMVWPAGPAERTRTPGPSRPGASSSLPSPSEPDDAGTSPEHDHDHRAPTAHYELVDRFVRVFTSPAPQRMWLRRLRPLVTTDLLAGFRYTELHRRPVAGRVESIAAGAELDEGTFVVTLSGGQRLLVSVTESWPRRVSSVAPVKEPDPSGSDA